MEKLWRFEDFEERCTVFLGEIERGEGRFQMQIIIKYLRQHPEMKPECLTTDRISSLPDNIIETILSLVPIRDAIRTSILSKKWRYNWNEILKLVFNEKDMFDKDHDEDSESEDEEDYESEEEEVSESEEGEDSEREERMLMRKYNKHDEIDKILTYLSRKNTIKKLALQMTGDRHCYKIFPYKLPSSVFAFRLLTDLYLQQCDLYHLPRASRFSCLTSLFLKDVEINAEMVLHIVSKCPLLKSFSLVQSFLNVTFTLAFLYKLFGCLPVIEHLNVAIRPHSFSKSNFALPGLPTPMVYLKYARLHGSCFVGEYGLSFAVNFIRSSVNLEKLKLQGYRNYYEEISEIDTFILEENSDIRLEHMKELEINVEDRHIPDDISEIDTLKFVKLILAISPVLKIVRITFHHIWLDEDLNILKDLSSAPRASQMAEFVVEHIYLQDDES
ncbi:F-box/FBD/LRR-repeat protein At1g13570-like [Rutidosis leptorrhynchoides]|uniref:F-box/FBD/LRR-repeat protein At1g13570-like n=1 Tax=Rutidosis leptorrhynchoides TaxID=125765 RepID=UPI003A9990C6